MLIYLISPFLITTFAVFLVLIYKKSPLVHNYLTNEIKVTLFLIVFTLIVFFIRQDITENCGCFSGVMRNIFSIDYILLASISLILFIVSLFARSHLFKITFLTIELIYWLTKLYFLQSGYQGGMGALSINAFDFIGLTARLWLINLLPGFKIREFLIPVIAGVLLTVKMYLVPCQENIVYEKYFKPIYNERLFSQINGAWMGSMLHQKDSVIEEAVENPDTIMYGNRPVINLHRDTIIFSSYENVYFFFNDSDLRIENPIPELNGQFCLIYSQPESKYFVYLPYQYLDSVKNDYHYNEYSITISFGEINDSTLSCFINGSIELKLRSYR